MRSFASAPRSSPPTTIEFSTVSLQFLPPVLPFFLRTHHSCAAPSEAFSKLFSGPAPGRILPSALLWLFELVCGVPAFHQASNFSRQPFPPCPFPTLWCEQSLSLRPKFSSGLSPDNIFENLLLGTPPSFCIQVSHPHRAASSPTHVFSSFFYVASSFFAFQCPRRTLESDAPYCKA